MINKTRGILYKLAKLSGDLSAISSREPGKVTKRIKARRIGGRIRAKKVRRNND